MGFIVRKVTARCGEISASLASERSDSSQSSLDFLAGNRHQSGNDVIFSSFNSTCTVSGLGASELDSEAPELRAPEVTFGRPVEGVSDSLTPGPLLNAPIAILWARVAVSAAREASASQQLSSTGQVRDVTEAVRRPEVIDLGGVALLPERDDGDWGEGDRGEGKRGTGNTGQESRLENEGEEFGESGEKKTGKETRGLEPGQTPTELL
ncbi:hypothetical protein HPB47_011570 [Ixodes persulcatus]|uniref:Uncharacterized protein n=1 Tax=Ixodes persulcatus TaxID=34615 RepID=A0AC60NW54_IXOPE|nr:hypothetical protein HPB47_011570 [Ixodes persulcatus]